MTDTKCAFKYVVFLDGIVTHFRSCTIGRGNHDSMTQVAEHRFSRCIRRIVVTKSVPSPLPLTQEQLYSMRLDMAVDEAIADGSAQKLFQKYQIKRA
jgi:hypothetical protein